ncbi:MAG TPA: polyprenyl synthetase family protein [Rhizomicrobium sp.]|jgi:octaprenyl-diphosphate synthase|nr:polyprenyl synthetase family protein [Rhizomicrobium sp.]
MIVAKAFTAPKGAAASPIDRLHSLLENDVAATDWLIHERMGSSATLIPDLARYLVDSGGKRLRPLLTLAAASACGHTGTLHIKLAAAVEFIHTATLLHDDVVDASSLRRGKLSANVVWGNKPSILVGDFLLSRAFQLMVETGDMGVLHILANASAVIAEGEVLQLKSANNLATTEDDYLIIVGAKTAALFAASAESGATIAKAPAETISAFKTFGHNLGVAFQLVDDALDYSGRQALMGKSVGDDFREAKVTLPVILAYKRADDDAKRFWQRTIQLGQQRDGDLQRAIDYIEHTGASAEARDQAHRYVRQACRALQPLSPGSLKDALMAVAEFCVARAY